MIIDFVIPQPAAAAARGVSRSGAAGRRRRRRLLASTSRSRGGPTQVREEMGALDARARRQQLQALHGLQERHHGRRREAGEQLHPRASSWARFRTVHAENGELVFHLQQELLKRRASPAPKAIRCRARPRSRARRPTARSRIAEGARHAALHRPQLAAAGRSRRSRAPAPRASACSARCWPGTCSIDDASTAIPTGDFAAAPRDEPAVPREGAPGRAVARPAGRQPADHRDRPLLLLRAAEGGGPRRLHQDPQRHRRRRGPHGACCGTTAWAPAG